MVGAESVGDHIYWRNIPYRKKMFRKHEHFPVITVNNIGPYLIIFSGLFSGGYPPGVNLNFSDINFFEYE